MKKNRFYIGFLLAALILGACSKDDNTGNLITEAWKLQNEQAFNDLANNPEYTKLELQGFNGSIYYRVLQKGEGKRLYYNSRAEVYYKGWFVVTNADKNIKEGYVFDKWLFDDGVTHKVAVNPYAVDDSYIYRSVIDGWTLALQYMVEGDKWEIRIPYRLGYGEEDYVVTNRPTIPGYSTLAFEIELVKAIDPDEF